jgi:hypothetical protein
MSGGSAFGNEGKQPLYRRRPSTRPPDVEQPQHAQEQIAHLERLGGQQALELDLLRSVSEKIFTREAITVLIDSSEVRFTHSLFSGHHRGAFIVT